MLSSSKNREGNGVQRDEPETVLPFPTRLQRYGFSHHFRRLTYRTLQALPILESYRLFPLSKIKSSPTSAEAVRCVIAKSLADRKEPAFTCSYLSVATNHGPTMSGGPGTQRRFMFMCKFHRNGVAIQKKSNVSINHQYKLHFYESLL
jgi:hypothetical protein